jgi:hypothetical protein
MIPQFLKMRSSRGKAPLRMTDERIYLMVFSGETL